MLAELGRGDQDLSVADPVVGHENDLEVLLGLVVIIDDLPDCIDEFDDLLGRHVPRRTLPPEQHRPGHHCSALVRAHGLDGQVPVDHVEDVHQLPFVLVDPLYVDVEKAVGPQLHPHDPLHVVDQPQLVVVLYRAPLLAEGLDCSLRLEFRELAHLDDPFVTLQAGGVEIRQLGVGAEDPAPGGHSVGLVLEFVGKEFSEILEEVLLDQLAVDGSHPVNERTAHDAQVGHTDHFRVFLDNREGSQFFNIPRILSLYLLKPVEIDQVDDLQVAGQQTAQKIDAPLFEGLG